MVDFLRYIKKSSQLEGVVSYMYNRLRRYNRMRRSSRVRRYSRLKNYPPRSKAANPPPRLGLLGQKLRKSRPGGRGNPSGFGTKHRPHFDLGCSCGYWAVLVASWKRFGTVLSGSWVPTWVPKRSQLGQKFAPKFDHFLDASWNRFCVGFCWILGL